MLQPKIIIAGPFDAGRIAIIKNLSQVSIKAGEKLDVDLGLGNQTVPIDYGRVDLEEDVTLHLFGVSDVEGVKALVEVLTEELLGFILVVDARDEESIKKCRELASYLLSTNAGNIVLAVDGVESSDEINKVKNELQVDNNIRIFSCNTSDKESSKEVLINFFYGVLKGLS